MIEVGIVGVRRGSTFFSLNRFDDVRVSAICDLRDEALATVGDAHDIEPARRFTDYEAMLEAVDAVVISSPIEFHAAQSIAALEAGKHVLCEVTAADTIDDCRRLVAAATASDAVYMFAENYCYRRPVVLVRELVRAGLFGEVYYGEGEYIHNCRHLHCYPDGSLTWRGHRRSTHNGISYPTHSLGPLAVIFDDRPISVQCSGSGSVALPEFSHDDSCIGLVRTQKGALWKIRFDSTSLRPHNMSYYQVQGTGGCWESPRADGESHKVWLADRADDPNTWQNLDQYADEFLPDYWRNPPEAAKQAGHGGGDWFELEDFVAAVRGEKPPAIDVFDAVSWTLTGLRSQESLEQGGVPLEVDDPATW